MFHSPILRPLRLLAASLVALVSLALLTSVASAQTDSCTPSTLYGGTVPPTVCGTSTSRVTVPSTSPTVLANTVDRGLAFTGGDIAGLLAIGGGAVAVGTALVLAARRRRSFELV